MYIIIYIDIYDIPIWKQIYIVYTYSYIWWKKKTKQQMTVRSKYMLFRHWEDTAPSLEATFPVSGKQGKQTSINGETVKTSSNHVL
jgi:hypothetical protein